MILVFLWASSLYCCLSLVLHVFFVNCIVKMIWLLEIDSINHYLWIYVFCFFLIHWSGEFYLCKCAFCSYFVSISQWIHRFNREPAKWLFYTDWLHFRSTSPYTDVYCLADNKDGDWTRVNWRAFIGSKIYFPSSPGVRKLHALALRRRWRHAPR